MNFLRRRNTASLLKTAQMQMICAKNVNAKNMFTMIVAILNVG